MSSGYPHLCKPPNGNQATNKPTQNMLKICLPLGWRSQLVVRRESATLSTGQNGSASFTGDASRPTRAAPCRLQHSIAAWASSKAPQATSRSSLIIGTLGSGNIKCFNDQMVPLGLDPVNSRSVCPSSSVEQRSADSRETTARGDRHW